MIDKDSREIAWMHDLERRKGKTMKINRNMSAVIASNQLLRTENKMTKTMERLSTGLKINSAEDNPAGVAISNKMRAQIDALDKAGDNSTDAISVMEIADGALNEVTSIIQRMRELSVQAASGTYTFDDKKAIQDEIEQLQDEVDRVSSNTEFNTKKLLDGSSDTRIYTRKKLADDATEITHSEITRINISDQVPSKVYTVDVVAVAEQAVNTIKIPNANTSAEGTISINGVSAKIEADTTPAELMVQLHDLAEEAGVTMKDLGGSVELTSRLYGSSEKVSITISNELATEMGYGPLAVGEKYQDESFGRDARIADISTGDGFTHPVPSYEGNRVYIVDDNGFKMDFSVNPEAAPGEYEIDVTEIGTMTIQIGANQYQEMDLRIPEISQESLYLDQIDVSVAGGAEKSIGILDEALEKVNSTRSRIGAFQNRLEYASASLDETSENMTAAYSNIIDADMAAEMTDYAAQSILNQAGISVLSQANDMPQQVLSLLSR